MAKKYMKRFQHHSPSGKYKLKPQDITSCLSDRLKIKNSDNTNADKDMEKPEHSHTAGRNVKQYRYFG